MSKRRVVVTGLGLLTPVGNDVESSWQALQAGKSGVGLIEHFDTSNYNVKIAACVKNFKPDLYLSAKDARKMDTFIQYGIAAGIQSIEDANLDINTLNPGRVGVAIGSGIGGLPVIEKAHTALMEGGPRKVSPFFVPSSIINMISGHLSIMYGFKGPNISVVTACTTGLHNIGEAARIVAYGDADIMIAGGAEMATSPLGVAGFMSARALSTRNESPEQASRPWDQDRDGFVMGEGAGVVVLEEYEVAKKRGAKIYAELAGYGMSGDAFHMTSPPDSGSGAQAAMRNALNDAKMNADEMDYINAHGTSTPAGDIAEATAIKTVYQDHASNGLTVSSTKSMIGHLLGAAGSVESIVSILALRDQVAPPTINLDNPSEGCDLDFVAHSAREQAITVASSNSFGFGGTNGTLIFKKL